MFFGFSCNDMNFTAIVNSVFYSDFIYHKNIKD